MKILNLLKNISGILFNNKNRFKIPVFILFLVLATLFTPSCSLIQEQINIEILNKDKPKMIDESEYQTYRDRVIDSEIIIKNLNTLEMRVKPYILTEEEVNNRKNSNSERKSSDGIGIILNFYSKNGKQIYFSDTPIIVSVEIFVEEPYGLDIEINEAYLGYKKYFYMSRTIAANELVVNNFIRIPYSDMNRKPSKYNQYGIVRVTVETSKQGILEVIDENVRLFISLD